MSSYVNRLRRVGERACPRSARCGSASIRFPYCAVRVKGPAMFGSAPRLLISEYLIFAARVLLETAVNLDQVLRVECILVRDAAGFASAFWNVSQLTFGYELSGWRARIAAPRDDLLVLAEIHRAHDRGLHIARAAEEAREVVVAEDRRRVAAGDALLVLREVLRRAIVRAADRGFGLRRVLPGSELLNVGAGVRARELRADGDVGLRRAGLARARAVEAVRAESFSLVAVVLVVAAIERWFGRTQTSSGAPAVGDAKWTELLPRGASRASTGASSLPTSPPSSVGAAHATTVSEASARERGARREL